MNDKRILIQKTGKINEQAMMGIGLVGSQRFCADYKAAFSKHKEISVEGTFSEEELRSDSDGFNRLLMTNEVIFFEKANTANIPTIISTLKNGRKVILDFLDIALEDLEELVKISNEGEIKCLVANHTDYYAAISDLAPEFTNPVMIEISLEMAGGESALKIPLHSHWIYEQLLKLRYFFKSDIKSISVHSAKIFSQNTNMLSLRLDFLNNCMVKIDLSEVSFEDKHTMKVVQPDKILLIDYIKSEAQIGSRNNVNQQNVLSELKKIPLGQNDQNTEKIKDLLMELNGSKNPGITLLDHYTALDLTSKILKKINSLHH